MNIQHIPLYITQEKLHHFISEALHEDVGDGDYSTLASVSENDRGEARLIVKEDCIIAGLKLAASIFKFYDQSLSVEFYKADGDFCRKGDIAFRVRGKAQSILTVERLLLNCMQRMSGIATYTHGVVELLNGYDTKILDTRKTTPNFRMCEKWAVAIGGGQNHRFGLYDMIMLKDNHIDYAGGITNAVRHTTEYLHSKGLNLKIEVETRNLDEVKEALATGSADIIMLDNMSITDMCEAVRLINGKALTEASGGITKDTIRSIAETHVDYISSGSIIYAAPIIDMSLKACK